MSLVFWLSCGFVAYVYAGYPALMALRARLAARRPPEGQAHATVPSISIVVAARNEAARIAARVENLLAIDYPERREIIVASDGSTDGTIRALERFGNAVQVLALPPGGKAAALNAAVARASHDVLVFADARQRFAPDALVEIVRPLMDPKVGAATGELVLDCEASERRSSTIADGLGLYWRYEKAIRRSESATRSTLGATGAIYAMRRSLWRPLPPETILDDVLAPMRVVLAGFRVVFTDRAIAYDRAADDATTEAKRKIRTLAGNYQILCLEPRLLLPWRNPVWLQYVSHKLGRLVVPYALVAMLASSMALAGRSLFHAAALAVQCSFYLLAGYGGWLDLRGSLAARGAAHEAELTWPPVQPSEPRGATNG